MKHTSDGDQEFEGFEAPQSSRSFVQVLWQRKAFVILGALLGLGAGFLWYTQKTTIYASHCPVLIVKKMPVATTAGIGSGVDDYMSTQIIVIKSAAVLKKAIEGGRRTGDDGKPIERPNLSNLQSFEGVDPVGYVAANLFAVRDVEKAAGAPNNIVNLTFRCPYPEDCPVILNNVVDAYQELVDDWFEDMNVKTMRTLFRQMEKLKVDLATISAEHHAFRKANKIIFTTSEKGYNPIQDLVAKLDARRTDLLIAKTGFEQEIKSFEEAIKDGKGSPYGYNLRHKLGFQISKYAEEVKFGESELANLKQLKAKAEQDFGPMHPAVQSLEKQIETMRKHYEDIQPPGLAATRDPVQNLMDQLNQEKKKLDANIVALDEQLVKYKAEAIRLGELELQELDFRQNKANIQAFFEGTQKNYQQLDLLKSANATGKMEARVLSQPGYGGKVYPVLTTDMALGMMLGLMVGIGLAYLADMADKSFRSPDEIRKQMGLPLVGHIPFFLPDPETAKRRAAGEATVEPMLCCYFKPKSLDSEAYRAVRTSLFFSTQGQGLKVIQVTSPNKGDGKSLLISNLAVTTAQSGKRVLLIDADCRRPRQHKVFNLSNSTGLVTVLNGQAAPDDVVQETCVPGLSVIGSGPVPPNPSELLVSPKFKETLDYFREQYDYVFVDTPPLLAVTDPCVVAGKVDGLFLAIRLTRRGRPDAERAREILSSLKVRTFGIVVNGVTRTNAGLYSSQAYDYSDKYMDYEDEEDKMYYYADDDAEAEAAAKGK